MADESVSKELQPPARRATDLPADAPWWARWIDANIKEAWKWGSVWWPAICAGAFEVYAQDPSGIQDMVRNVVPSSWWPHILALGCVVSIFLRVLNLSKLKLPTKGDTP